MELVSGPRLSQARPTDLARVVDYRYSDLRGARTRTRDSIVHRDLKPDNVLLSRTSNSSTVKLADLGLALPAYAARISRAGVIVGTAAYMAPEQALGQTVDGRTDLYALGVLLYELTTGRLALHRRRSAHDCFTTRTRVGCAAACASSRLATRARNDHRAFAGERSGAAIQHSGRDTRPRCSNRLNGKEEVSSTTLLPRSQFSMHFRVDELSVAIRTR